MNLQVITLDVREDLRQGREPFTKIMRVATGVGVGERLRVITPFEPVPLFHALGQLGFSHHAELIAPGHWEVEFLRREVTDQPEPAKPADCPERSAGLVEVDARGLEPPEPLVRILESLETLPAGTAMIARTDRRPIHLYPHLLDRGFSAATEEETDGSYVTRICRL